MMMASTMEEREKQSCTHNEYTCIKKNSIRVTELFRK